MNRRLYYLVIMITCFLITGCNQKYEERNSGISENSSESQEWQPFEDMSDVTVYEFDPDNIIGLKTIYLKDKQVIYRFENALDCIEGEVWGLDKDDKKIELEYSKIYELNQDYFIEISHSDPLQLAGINARFRKGWEDVIINSYKCPRIFLWRSEICGSMFVSDTMYQTFDEQLGKWMQFQECHDEVEYTPVIN